MQIFFVEFVYLINKKYLKQTYFSLKYGLMKVRINQIYYNFVFKIEVIFSIHSQINEFFL